LSHEEQPPTSVAGTFRTPPRGRRRIKVNLPLRFCHEILDLDHLHYGLWDGEELTREGLVAAQDRYTETLVEWIPEGVRTLLDVGAGTGATARDLRDRGFEVEGLSPDPYQRQLFARRVGRPFHLGRFQEFEPAYPYDLVLMSESSQYIWLDSLFPAVRRVAPGGHLLVADYFVVHPDGGPMSKSGHPLDDYLEKAEKNGLELLRREDVTEATLPTLDLARQWLDRYVDPTLAMVGEHLQGKYPRLAHVGRWLLRKKLAEVDHARALLDSEAFRRVKSYELMLFRVP